MFHRFFPMFIANLALIPAFGSGAVQEGQLEKALAIRPNQKDVEIDQPAAGELARCKLERTAESLKVPGWRIKDPTGRTIRLFLDTNKDSQLDVWSFFRNGVEVYRDIDSDFDNKTDQYRWFGFAGSRWGIDKNQDGVIDQWKSISAEELASEVFAAIRERDKARFVRVLLSDNELQGLQLGPKWTRSIEESLSQATSKFDDFVRAQKSIQPKSEFLHFGSARPSAVPAGSEGMVRDQLVYDHASAVYQNDQEFGQLALGTLIRVGDSWRAFELPGIIEAGKAVANGGFFLNSGESLASATASGAEPGNEKMSALLEQFEGLEKKLAAASGPEIEKLEQSRSELFLQLIQAAAEGEEQNNWIRLAADAICNSYQEGRFAAGLERLADIRQQLGPANGSIELDYIQWRIVSTRFSKNSQGNNQERAAANERYFQDLKGFIAEFPSSEFAAEAMMQLALYAEVSESGDLDEAVEWYSQVEKKFPGTPFAKRASGAKVRLTSAGKPIAFKGKTINGKFFDLGNKDLRGRIVVLHYWASWCEGCLKDFEELQRLSAKYRDELVVVGVNIDDDEKVARSVLEKHKSAAWTQLFEPGGMNDSPLAQQLGATTLPLTVLIDKEGKLVDASITVSDLDRGIQRLQRNVEETARKN